MKVEECMGRARGINLLETDGYFQGGFLPDLAEGSIVDYFSCNSHGNRFSSLALVLALKYDSSLF